LSPIVFINNKQTDDIDLTQNKIKGVILEEFDLADFVYLQGYFYDEHIHDNYVRNMDTSHDPYQYFHN
jgi:hypothetical protein